MRGASYFKGLVFGEQEKRGISNWVIVVSEFYWWGSVGAYLNLIVL